VTADVEEVVGGEEFTKLVEWILKIERVAFAMMRPIFGSLATVAVLIDSPFTSYDVIGAGVAMA
jgi:hypothetical protein